jgi:hypothetical protein
MRTGHRSAPLAQRDGERRENECEGGTHGPLEELAIVEEAGNATTRPGHRSAEHARDNREDKAAARAVAQRVQPPARKTDDDAEYDDT